MAGRADHARVHPRRRLRRRRHRAVDGDVELRRPSPGTLSELRTVGRIDDFPVQQIQAVGAPVARSAVLAESVHRAEREPAVAPAIGLHRTVAPVSRRRRRGSASARRWYTREVTGRIVIVDARPRTPTGRYPAKAVIGQPTTVSADIFRDGHDLLAARVRWRPEGESKWRYAPMADARQRPVDGHHRAQRPRPPRVRGSRRGPTASPPGGATSWSSRPRARTSRVELEEGARLLERRAGRRAPRPTASPSSTGGRRPARPQAADAAGVDALDPDLAAVLRHRPRPRRPHPVRAHRPVGRPGAGRVLAPGTSCSPAPRAASGRRPTTPSPGRRRHGLRRPLPAADPPHRRARHRKGRNNTLDAGPDDPGSPWAIGSDRRRPHRHRARASAPSTTSTTWSQAARDHDMEVALDYALQCSPDHPWVTEHPEWFHHRPDGTIKYAENPPKKYQDIYPINFWPDDDGRPRGAVAGVQGHPRLLDRPRRAHLPGRQPPHQAAGLLGVADPRGAGATTPTCSSWPRPSPGRR